MNLLAELQELRDVWAALFPAVPVPDDARLAIWLLKHGAPIARSGILELAVKYQKLSGKMDSDYMGKFASAVMNRMTLQASIPQMPVAKQTKEVTC